MNFELGPIEKYANNSSFTKSIQYLPRSKSPEPNSCLRSVQGSRYGLLPQRRRMPFRFRWAKTANRKTPSKRFDCRTVLSKNQFGAHDRRETVWRRSHSLFPYGLFKSRLSSILSLLSLKNGHSSYYIDFIGLFGHNDPYNRIYSTALKGDAYENVLPKSQG